MSTSRSESPINRQDYRRTFAGQRLHSAIMQYIKSANKDEAFVDLQAQLESSSIVALNERSTNGYSHMHDALHIPFDIITDTDDATRVSLNLFYLLTNHCHRTELSILRNFLVAKNQVGYTPLDTALEFTNPDIINAFFDEMQLALCIGTISLFDYRQCLINTTPAGHTPLSRAFNSNKYRNVNAFMREIARAYREGDLSKDEYTHILLNKNINGYTPLHDAANKCDHASFCIYLATAYEAYQLQIITPDQYRTLLLGKTMAGLSALSILLKKGNLDNIYAFLEDIHKAYQSKVISANDYIKLLLDTHGSDDKPLLVAIRTGNMNVVRVIFNKLQQACESGIITQYTDRNEYSQSLVTPTNRMYTPLHIAADTGSFEIVRFFCEKLFEAYRDSPQAIASALHAKTDAGLEAGCSSSKIDASEINTYLTQLRKSYAKYLPNNHDGFASPYARYSFTANLPRASSDPLSNLTEYNSSPVSKRRKQLGK